MAGPSERADLKPGILTEKQLKAPNEQVLYILQHIKDAMKDGRRITFRYFVYAQNMKRVAKHDGYRYEVSPYALIWQRDRYYLVGWSEKHNDVARFRIDRMEVPRILKKKVRAKPEDLHLEDHSDRIFSMFDGPEENVTLRFRPHLINNIVDRFGKKIKITQNEDDSLEVTVPVHISPTFYGWLFQYAGEMMITGPENVREEYEKRLRGANSLQGR